MMKEILLVTIACAATMFAGCGTDTASCTCEICVNGVPEFPSDSEASCAEFAVQQSCTAYSYSFNTAETCGADPQPACAVNGCGGSCTCPNE